MGATPEGPITSLRVKFISEDARIEGEAHLSLQKPHGARLGPWSYNADNK
jgi:hypothetical protein